MEQQSESKTKQFADGAAGELVSQPFEFAFEVAMRALGEALSCAGDVAVSCGEVAVDVTCAVAGSAIDGL